jgi:hypothetical protein
MLLPFADHRFKLFVVPRIHGEHDLWGLGQFGLPLTP